MIIYPKLSVKYDRTKLIRKDNKLCENEEVTNALFEELSSFSGQYDVARECCVFIRELYSKGEKKGKYRLSVDFPGIKRVSFEIVDVPNLVKLFFRDSEGQTLYVAISEQYVKHASDDFIIKAIAHELMHGFSMFHDIDIKDDPMSVSMYYDEIVNKIINNEKYEHTYVFAFCYGLYMCCEQEVKAFVSTVNVEVYDAAKKDFSKTGKRLLKKDFLQKVFNSSEVEHYKNNIENATDILSLEDALVYDYIINPLRDEKVKGFLGADPKRIRDHCRDIIRISEYALKKCHKNAMIAYEKLVNEDMIDYNSDTINEIVGRKVRPTIVLKSSGSGGLYKMVGVDDVDEQTGEVSRYICDINKFGETRNVFSLMHILSDSNDIKGDNYHLDIDGEVDKIFNMIKISDNDRLLFASQVSQRDAFTPPGRIYYITKVSQYNIYKVISDELFLKEQNEMSIGQTMEKLLESLVVWHGHDDSIQLFYSTGNNKVKFNQEIENELYVFFRDIFFKDGKIEVFSPLTSQGFSGVYEKNGVLEFRDYFNHEKVVFKYDITKHEVVE